MQKKYLWIYLIWVYGAAWLMWSIAIVVGTNSYLYHVNTVVAMLAPEKLEILYHSVASAGNADISGSSRVFRSIAE